MLSFVSTLASQIGYLIQSLNEDNYRSVTYELTRFTGHGLDGSIVLLQTCLDQVNLCEGDVQNMQSKLDLLGIVVKYLLHQSNFSTVFCEALKGTHTSENVLGDLSKALHLSLPEQIGLGLALADSDDTDRSQEGQNFCKVKIMELYQNPVAGVSEDLIEQVLLFLYQSEGLSKLVPTFLQSLSLLQPKSQASLLLTPLCTNEVYEVNSLRSFESYASSAEADEVLLQVEKATNVADVMEDLGYGCTIDGPHCKNVLSLFSPLNENIVSKIISMVVRTHTGLEDSQGVHSTFCTAVFNCSTTDSSWLTSWNIDVLLDSIKQLAPEINWVSVMENLDHVGFYLPDQKAFSLLMSIYAKTCQDPFPLQAVCGSVWGNNEGQLSFLRYAISSSPEVFTFAHSRRRQTPLEGPHGNKLPYGSANQAWLSIDLLEVLCQLAEMGHGSVVRMLLEHPLKHCPETLLAVIAQVKTAFNLLQYEILSSLFPLYLEGNPNSSIILHQLWHVNPEMVLWGMMDVHTKDPSSISKILDACQDLKALSVVLDMTPFSFAIELAALASRREYLNLEKWLNDNLSSHRDTLFEACLKFLRERTLFEASNDASVNPAQRSGPIVSLSLETTAVFFKVLQANVGQLLSRDLAEEMKRLHSATVRVNPRLLSVGAAEQSASEVFAADIEEEANSYFQQIYVGQLTIDAIVQMLARFKESSEKREQEIFACMIQSLFDEYRFFPRYPERELRITAILFGSLIKHQLVSSLTLGIALRYVLDALRKPLDSKMFSFGLTALEQFMDRLVEWPQYCNHILQISHVRDAHGELVEFIERALARVSMSQSELIGGNAPSTDQHQSSMPSSLENNETSEVSWQLMVGGPTTTQSVLAQRQQAAPATYVKQPSLIPSGGQSASVTGQLDAGAAQKVSQSLQATPSQQVGSGATSMLSGQGFLCNARGSTVPALRQTLNSFGHALNIETLVAAAERRDTPIEAPGSEVQDKIAFMINNISSANLEAKSKEFLEVLKEQYYPWFAQYMVMKRASIEPNFHDLYLKFLDKINSKALHKEIIKATYENCKVLLRSELIKSSSEERSLLKNLGSWLGKLTIGRNQALRAREIDPKVLIIEAYEKGLMIAIIPFTSKILEPCQSSLAYQPPNPWTMGILSLLAEIYALPNLKMNLKFDIEVLFKNLGVDMKDLKPTQLLKGRAREIEGNPDFSSKDLGVAQQQVVTDSAGMLASISQLELQPEMSTSTSNTSTHSLVLPQFTAPLHLSSNNVGEDEKVSTLALPAPMQSGQGLPQSAPAQSPYSSNQLSMQIPNIGAYVVVNPKLNALGQQLQFQRLVPMAMERAIREIISPVVERSVTIACMTTRELVMKDYAMESEENRIRHSANLMVASLAGSLAHVTCKEPLRLAMANHLRSMLQALNVVGDVLEQAVQLVTNDNLDLGCAVIEQAATEKALRDLDDVIGHSLAIRRKHRETLGAAFYDATIYSQGTLARLPEQLRPKPGRLSIPQQRVYEDFARLPWQNQPSPNTPVVPVGPSNSSGSSIGHGFSRVVYGSGSGQGSSSGYTTAQATSGLAGIDQTLEQTSEELDSRATPPLSTSVTQVAMADGGMRQVADLSLTTSFTTSSSAVGEAHVLEGVKESGSIAPPSTSSSTAERLATSGLEPSLSTGEALEKYQLVAQKIDAIILKGANDHDFQGLVSEIPEIILQCISRDEAALAIAQKVFRKLYENASNSLHVSTHIAILAAIHDVCKRVVKELTIWVIYSDEERKFNKDITVALIRSELIHLTEYNMHLAKLMDGGRNVAATEFAISLVRTCVVQEPGVSATELYNLIDALGKVAQRPGSPESLQQLVEIAKNSSSNVVSQTGSSAGKEEKSRQSRDKKVTPGRPGTSREDNKPNTRDTGSADPAGFREQVVGLFDEWARICESPGVNDKAYAVYISQLQQIGMLKGDDVSDRFFRVLTELSVTHCLASEQVAGSVSLSSQQMMQSLSFTAIDMYAKLVVLLVKYCAVDPGMSKVNLLNKVLAVTVRVIQRDAEEKKTSFHPRPYFRLFVNWLMDLNSPDPALDASNFQVLTAFANAFHSLQPLRVPGWSFAWLELISHRSFMPKLLTSNNQKGCPLVQRLLVDLFKFMEPYLRNAELSDPVRLLYKGTLRVLLVLLHDFPEFLCDYHFSFCDVIPPSCIQMRNLILSAFPRNMRLPDPFTPNLKVDLLPEISQSPRIFSEVDAALKSKQLKSEIDEYLKTRSPMALPLAELKQRLLLPQHEAVSAGTRYNVPLINSLVLYVGMQAIQQLQSKTTPQQLAVPTAPITHSAPMDIFQRLIVELDTEGRYLFLNAVANQLRYPNNHTHYFSCVLLYLFAEAMQEIIQEQITRVLLERLIVNRPHPWGLLITFIELIKNPRYNFWNRGFTHCAPEIEKLFESVARSCMGPPMKPVEDDIASSIAAENNH